MGVVGNVVVPIMNVSETEGRVQTFGWRKVETGGTSRTSPPTHGGWRNETDQNAARSLSLLFYPFLSLCLSFSLFVSLPPSLPRSLSVSPCVLGKLQVLVGLGL